MILGGFGNCMYCGHPGRLRKSPQGKWEVGELSGAIHRCRSKRRVISEYMQEWYLKVAHLDPDPPKEAMRLIARDG